MMRGSPWAAPLRPPPRNPRTPRPPPRPYINAVELDIVPAEFEKFKAAILENAAASVKEPGCRQFDVLLEECNPHHVFLYEVYDDRRPGGASRDGAFQDMRGDGRGDDRQARGAAHVADRIQRQGALARDHPCDVRPQAAHAASPSSAIGSLKAALFLPDGRQRDAGYHVRHRHLFPGVGRL
jgi:quinol monooxygenase YgiN